MRKTTKKAAAAPTETPVIYFKVLDQNGRSTHQSMEWSLPTIGADGANIPGEWHEVDGEIVICSWGLHLTYDPKCWWSNGAVAYIAEFDPESGGTNGVFDTEEDRAKVVGRRARLLRPASVEELAAVNIFVSGSHAAKEGVAFASGDSTVRAYGNSTVEAYDNSTVRAYDNSTVEAYGNSTVEAYGNSTVRASGNSTVRAYDNSTVEAYGNSSTTSTRYHDSTAVVTTGNQSVHIDRRGNVVKIIVGGIEHVPVAVVTQEGGDN